MALAVLAILVIAKVLGLGTIGWDSLAVGVLIYLLAVGDVLNALDVDGVKKRSTSK